MTVTKLPGSGKPLLEDTGDLAEEIHELIAKHSERMPLAAAVGVLDIVRFELIMRHYEE